MSFKHNAYRRHRIGKMKFKVTNWREYETGLRRRGSLTLWVTPEALSSWQAPKRTTRGGQPRYSDLAIETALTLGLVFDLRLRQTEGFVTSMLKLIGLDLVVPDHTTVSRRANKPRAPNKESMRNCVAIRPRRNCCWVRDCRLPCLDTISRRLSAGSRRGSAFWFAVKDARQSGSIASAAFWRNAC